MDSLTLNFFTAEEMSIQIVGSIFTKQSFSEFEKGLAYALN